MYGSERPNSKLPGYWSSYNIYYIGVFFVSMEDIDNLSLVTIRSMEVEVHFLSQSVLYHLL